MWDASQCWLCFCRWVALEFTRLVAWLSAFVELCMFNASFGSFASTPFVSTATKTLSWFGTVSSHLVLRNEQPWSSSFPWILPPTKSKQKLNWYSGSGVWAWPCTYLEDLPPFPSFLQSSRSTPHSLSNPLYAELYWVGSVFPWIQAFNFRCGCWLFQVFIIISNLMGKEAAGIWWGKSGL